MTDGTKSEKKVYVLYYLKQWGKKLLRIKFYLMISFS